MISTEVFPKRILLGLSANFISIQHENSNAFEVIGPLWGRASQLFFSANLPDAANALGIGAMWNTNSGIPGEMTYFAGYEVESIPDEIGDLEVLELESGNYAFVTHDGPLASLGATVSEFYARELPESVIARRDGVDLEIYYSVGDEQTNSRVVVAAPIG